MNIKAVLEQVDAYYEKNQGQEAEKLLRESAAQAMQEKDDGSLLQILNELLGYYRETGQREASYAVGDRAVSLAEKMNLENTIPYATTLSNTANAYRAGGDPEKALYFYRRVQEIYDSLLASDDILMAGLWNNMSLVYQEQGQFEMAREYLLKALAIVEKKGAAFETAVTCANLAGTCMQLDREEEASAYAERAIQDFEKMGVKDAHYSAALSAMGTYYYRKKEYASARKFFQKAMDIVEAGLGQNEHYRRLQKNVQACEEAMGEETEKGSSFSDWDSLKKGTIKGMELCREFYERYGRPMLEKRFPEYLDKIAVGLVGEGSDCFGYDDVWSRDHDWGPDFCVWVTEEVWDSAGEELCRALEELPREAFLAEKLSEEGAGEAAWKMPQTTAFGQGRRGVMTISAFYKRLLQADSYEAIDWRTVSDAALAAAVNGQVFYDGAGEFTAFREKLLQGYPEEIRFLKLAESAARFAQTAQYNYARMKRRGDNVTAEIMLADGMREAMKLQHYIEGKYPPHDKWLYQSTKQLTGGEELCRLLEQLRAENIEETAAFLAKKLYEKSFISDTEPYLDAHTQELLYKAKTAGKSNEELVEEIARLEFQAFDKVHNYGGRASCQNDWATFSIMRKSQYLTWNRAMLQQYLYDFQRELDRGHNLIEEKYGRMMESTAPEEYERIKDHFPALSQEKKQIIEQIVSVQVKWMEEFAEKYPHLADNARSVHTYDDNLYNTSYETYLRGELGTYSDKMLELYGRYVVEYAMKNKNLTFEIMTNSAKLYGYDSLDAAEAFLKL